MTGTGAGYSIQAAGVLGFTPSGFDGNCIYPDSVFLADLQIQFSSPLVDFSIMFSPEEYACDSSATIRCTASLNGNVVGTSTAVADPPGTWPTGTLRFTSNQPFDSVVIHYAAAPPTGGDWGPIFMADNMRITPATSLIAVDDQYTTASGSQLSVNAASGVLINDLNAAGATVTLMTSPAHGTLSLQSNGSFTYISEKKFAGVDTFTYRDTLNGKNSGTGTVSILVEPGLNGLTASPTTVIGGQDIQGTVSLSANAPDGGVTIQLSTNSKSVTPPSQVLVAAGSSTAVFVVKTSSVSTKSAVTLTATLIGVSKTANVTLYPAAKLVSMLSTPTTLVGGSASTVTISLSGPVPAGSEVISLTSGNPALLVPATVTIPAGKSKATFTLATLPVSKSTTGTISASLFGLKVSETLAVTTPAITSVTISPKSIKGGLFATGTVTLAGKAGPQGDVIQVTSANSSVIVAGTVTVPAGATTATFAISSKAVTSTKTVKITATLGTSSKFATLTLTR